MKPVRVFFAQPVDGIPPATINENITQFKVLTKQLQLDVITPYSKDVSTITDREKAKEVVQSDYLAVETCDIYLADISKINHLFVGIFFEMAYAASLKKIIIVYSGSSSIHQRTFILAHADFACKTWNEVLDCIKKCKHL